MGETLKRACRIKLHRSPISRDQTVVAESGDGDIKNEFGSRRRCNARPQKGIGAFSSS
jgi:hypothetical protein